jgi:hypothetical protein
VIFENLTIRGSEAALRIEGGGEAVLRHVRLASPGTAFAQAPGSTARGEDLEVLCGEHAVGAAAAKVAGGLLSGLRIDGAHFKATDLTVLGPCRRSVELTRSDVELSRVTVTGAREAGIHMIDSMVHLQTASVAQIGGGAAGLFEASSKLDGHDIRISGGEEGILLRSGESNLDGVEISGSGATGYASVKGSHVLAHAHLVGPFREAALSALNGTVVKATAVDVTKTGAAGLLAIRSTVDIDGMQVDAAHTDSDGDFGHAFLLQRSRGKLKSVRATHADGAAIYASGIEADVTVDGCEADQVATGVTVVLNAHLDVRGLHVSNAPLGIMANGEGSVAIRDSSLHALVGVIACQGSTVAEELGVEIKADARRRTCTDDALDVAWRAVLRAP